MMLEEPQPLDRPPGPAADVLRFFHPVLPSKGLRRGPVRVRVAGRDYALFRDTKGRAAALDDTCPHRRAPLSHGTVRPDGRLACGYHGWHFDRAGQGRSPSCPALRHCDVRAYTVVERYDYVWMARAGVAEAAFPVLPCDGFDFAGTITTRFDAPIEVALDNISEDEHFAFIHSTFGWDEASAAAVEIETTNYLDRSEVRLTSRQRSSAFAPLGGVRSGDRFRNGWTTWFDPVRSVYTFWWEDPKSERKRPITTRAVVFLVPEAPKVTHAHMFVFLAIAPSVQRLFRPVSHWLACRVARMELQRDAQFAAHLADRPTTLRGMRLTQFDKALIHNRRLLRERYWGEEGAAGLALASSDEQGEARHTSGGPP